MSKPVLITITGPTCSGKTTLAASMTRELGIPEVLSFTTRPPREGEVDGVNYRFLSEREGDELSAKGDIAELVRFNGYWYGSTKSDLEKAFAAGAGFASIVVEPDGAAQFEASAKRMGFTVFSVYVGNGLPVLVKRLLARFKNDAKADPAAYAVRMLNMIEVECPHWYNEQVWDFVVTAIDDDLHACKTAYWIEAIRNSLGEFAKRLD